MTSWSRPFEACVLVLAAMPLGAQSLPRQSAASATAGGDPARGRALVEASKCLDCHRIEETGSRLGPDLSEIGKLRSPDLLQRAIVAPDADVLPEHRHVRLVTRDGIVVVGRLLNQDALHRQSPGRRRRERRRSIPDRGGGLWRGPGDRSKTGEKKWDFKMVDYTESGILTTAADLLFSGGREGHFFALDARTGELLWKTNLGGTVASGPMTYAAAGHQYVAVSADNALYVFGLPD
ncbi:MAG: hypothetical protein DMF95_30020 [Acidobacteria bacterium]|nr:MAG: hypothetical protein DMF95_30020 [Acidobacteriota bacterium]